MKISKEIKTGIFALLAIGLIIAGINFLKGNSFFGGDKVYYLYLNDSGGIAAATSVSVNGVIVGKVMDVTLTNNADPKKKVLVTFNIQDRQFRIPVNSNIHVGSTDFLSKGLIIIPSENVENYYEPGAYIQGQDGSNMLNDVKNYADPLIASVQSAVRNIDSFVVDFSAFWDTTANQELKNTLVELRTTLNKFGSVANEVDDLLKTEKKKLSKILSNVESISDNLAKSNSQIEGILGNAKKFTDELVTADFKGTIEEAKTTLSKVNSLLESASKGEGTLGKLLSDDQLYNELNKTNQRLQNLVDDIQLHPERYIHFSVFGAKTKGANLSSSEEKQLKQLLDSIKTN